MSPKTLVIPVAAFEDGGFQMWEYLAHRFGAVRGTLTAVRSHKYPRGVEVTLEPDEPLATVSGPRQ